MDGEHVPGLARAAPAEGERHRLVAVAREQVLPEPGVLLPGESQDRIHGSPIASGTLPPTSAPPVGGGPRGRPPPGARDSAPSDAATNAARSCRPA